MAPGRTCEARVGQKNKITRRWAERGTRPCAPHDQRTASTYIFGAICPREGKGAALVLPHCDTEAMSLHLAEIATAVAPRAHACCSSTRRLAYVASSRCAAEHHDPAAARRMPGIEPGRERLAVHAPQLAVEAGVPLHNAIVDHCCEAWNKLTDQPWRIMSIRMRDWAHRF
jgi:hypothetical protein